MRCLVKLVYPALVVLCLEDQKQPAMDRLYFYTKRLDETLNQSKPKIDKMDNNYKEMEGSEISFKMLNYFLANDKETANCYNEITNKGIENIDSDNESSCSESGSEVISDDDTVKTTDSFRESTPSDKIMGFLIAEKNWYMTCLF
jgi:hypothetical protein